MQQTRSGHSRWRPSLLICVLGGREGALRRAWQGRAGIVLILLTGCALWRMSEDARRAVFVARNEAIERGASGIDTEHLLLGVIRSDPQLARRVAAAAGFEPEALVRRVDQLSPRKPKASPQPVDMPLREHASEAVGLAGRQLAVEVTTADLMAALIRVDGIASQVLRELGVTEPTVREQTASRGTPGRQGSSDAAQQ
jgi:ATP-dependent Clp protease ATP-binding subunit ClpA